jgi:hypothetical protein
MPVRTVIEHGPKEKRSVAFSIDWPGWSRGAKTADLAVETLESYRERYRPVAGLAGMSGEFEVAGPLEIVEDKVGTGSTDFWGITRSTMRGRWRTRTSPLRTRPDHCGRPLDRRVRASIGLRRAWRLQFAGARYRLSLNPTDRVAFALPLANTARRRARFHRYTGER